MDRAELYRQHLGILDGYLADALERCGRRGGRFTGVVLHAGRQRTYHADDREIPFQSTPHFRRWVPLAGPEHLAVVRPGKRPLVVRVRPADYWYDNTPAPPSYWEEAVELVDVTSFSEALAAGGPLDGLAYVGDSPEAAAELGIPEAAIEPGPLLDALDWYRAYKTRHEVECVRVAAQRAAAGHRGALEVFRAGGSEREIHWAYLEGSGLLEQELPFETIVALDSKGAFLHYQHKRGAEAAPGRVLLLDAGGASDGYAADITRTWLREPDEEPMFRMLLAGLDELQRELVRGVRPGRAFTELHDETHRRLAALLVDVGVVKASPEAAIDRGVTRAFMPHGLGHHLGIQVHDVGGRLASPDGDRVPPPETSPALRTTRALEPGHLVTIEPGLYFIDMLLEPLRSGEAASLVDWRLVDRLAPLGGMRIEDDILCSEDEPEDLTRPLLPGPADG